MPEPKIPDELWVVSDATGRLVIRYLISARAIVCFDSEAEARKFVEYCDWEHGRKEDDPPLHTAVRVK